MKAALETLEPPVDLDDEPAARAEHAVTGLPAGVDLLNRLEAITARRGFPGLADRLHELADFVAGDMATFEHAFGRLPRDPRLVGRAAHHLVDLGGKRLRPMCVLLAARLGNGPSPAAFDLGVAVELVHAATLLHDDVVDLGESRRGAPTARRVYGNAASIFAGDWLLIEALRRVERHRLPGLLEALFDTIEEMIFAESIQLENRGSAALGRDDYFRVVEGKTASVFRWAMAAGARAGGLDDGERHALEGYGRHLGIAFQAVDDLLDLTGDTTQTGKALFADLREGKMTYPVILGLERDSRLLPLVESIIAAGDAHLSDTVCTRLIQILRDVEAMRDGLALAREHSARAVAQLEILPAGRARQALATVAEAIVDRDL